MAQTANIRSFRRTQIPPVEQIIGGCVLALLIAVGLIIVLKGQSYDPATYAGDPEALESTRQAVTGKAATLREQADLRAYEQAPAAGPGAAAPADTPALPALVDGLVPMGPTEFYDEDSLYEKINGRAPIYFEYNFQSLISRSFSIPETSAGYLDIYLYEMDSPLNAFGIFSAERGEGEPLDFVMDGYRSEMGYFLRVGETYAQVLASSTDADVMAAAGQFSRELTGFLDANDSGLEGRALLPEEGRIPGSLNYINDNAYGQAVLSQVFEARYEVDDLQLTLFAQASDPQTARSTWETLREFHGKYGSLEEPYTHAGAEIFVADMFGQWNVIYRKDGSVSGVVNAPSRDPAVDFVHARLGTATDESPPTDDYPY